MSNSVLFECLRFGSSIPGGYWGCCAGDVFQCFKSDPDEKASIQFVNGDGGEPVTDLEGNLLFAGPTNKDVFLARLRDGTFGTGDMANHFFIAVLTQSQLGTSYGKKWLAILKEHGFEFIRTVANSVYTDSEIMSFDGTVPEAKPCPCGDPDCTLLVGGATPSKEGRSLNYVFGLFRGIAYGAPEDQYTPPQAWTDLPQIKQEAWQLQEKSARVETTEANAKVDIEIWNRVGPAKLLTEKQIREAGAPVILAAKRTANPQEPVENRTERETAAGKKKEASLRITPSPAVGSPTPSEAG